MKKPVLVVLAAVVWSSALSEALAQAVPLLQMTDPILAIDTDPPAMQTRVSMYPGNEPPAAALDGLATSKYLNFGTLNTGFIVTPESGPSIIQSMQFQTANDAVGRDPASWKLWGTNDPITSVEHSDGSAENWSLIAEGPVALPDERQTLGPLLPFSNSNQYSSYRLIFPTIKDFPAANSMQIADVFMFKDMAGTDPIPLSDFDPVIAVQLEPAIITGLPDSSSPAAETADKLLDGSATYMRGAGTFLTKYLNFGDVNSGFIVTPAVGASIVTSFQMTTADDAMERDPSTWELYGTNDPITSTNHSQGNAESWTLIDSGSVDLPPERQTAGPVVTVENSTTAYKSYRMIFPTLRADPVMPNSMQLAGIEFFGDLAGGLEGDFNSDGRVDAADYVVWRKTDGTQPGYDMWRTNFGRTAGAGSSLGGSAVPEPGTIGLGLLTLLALGRLRRARRQMT